MRERIKRLGSGSIGPTTTKKNIRSKKWRTNNNDNATTLMAKHQKQTPNAHTNDKVRTTINKRPIRSRRNYASDERSRPLRTNDAAAPTMNRAYRRCTAMSEI